MSNCIISRNTAGAIIGVKASNGQESELFKTINSNVFMADADTSLKVMLNSFTEAIQSKVESGNIRTYSTGEPMITYRNPQGKDFTDLEELLIDGSIGTMEMGFMDEYEGDFIPVARFNTDATDESRLITDKVREGVISAERVLGKDGINRYQGKGEYLESKIATARIFSLDAKLEQGIPDVKVNSDGTIEVGTTDTMVTAVIDGVSENVRIQDIPEFIEDRKPDNAVELLTTYKLGYDNPRDRVVKITSKGLSPKVLENKLYRFLESLGFTTTTLQEYRKTYKEKYGEDPQIGALADIANRVVAFAEGDTSVEDFSEEVAHIALELWADQEAISGLLLNAHVLPEYAEFAETYRQKYSPFYSGVELEDQVRREILGKHLAKAIVSNFSTSELTPEATNLSRRLRNIWENILNSIQSIFKPYHKKAIDLLNKQIAESIFSGQTDNFNVDRITKNFYYSLMSTEAKTLDFNLKATRKSLEVLYKSVLRKPVPSQAQLAKIEGDMDNLERIKSSTTIIGIVDNLMKRVSESLKEARRNGTLISENDKSLYTKVTGELLPQAEQIVYRLKQMKADVDPDMQRIIDSLEDIVKEVVARRVEISPLMQEDSRMHANQLLEEVIEAAGGITPEQAEAQRTLIDGNTRDLSWTGLYFGLMSKVVNPVAKLIHREVAAMYVRVQNTFSEDTEAYIDDTYDNGREKFQKSIIQRDANGKGTYYFEGPVRQDLYDLAKTEEEERLISEITGRSMEDIKKLKKDRSNKDLLGTQENYDSFREQMTAWDNGGNIERRGSDKYYEEADKKFELVDASPLTVETLRNANREQQSIIGKYRKNGKIDFSELSAADRIDLENARKTKALLRSSTDQFGNTRPGLKRVKIVNLSQRDIANLPEIIQENLELLKEAYGSEITVIDNTTKDQLLDDSRIALDMQNLTLLYIVNLQDGSSTGNPTKDFQEAIRQVEAEDGDSLDWVNSNTRIGFTDDFYNGIGDSVGYVDTAQEYIDSLEDEEIAEEKQVYLDNLKGLKIRLKELLKQHQLSNNPMEIDAYNIPGPIKDAIVDLESEIENMRNSIRVPKEILSGQTDSNSTRGVNEAFQKDLIESGKSEYEFSLKHMTSRKSERVRKFALDVEDLLNGRLLRATSKSFEDFISEMIDTGKIDASMSKETAADTLRDEFAKRNVAGYYQRYEPQGYTELQDAIKRGEVKLSDAIDKQSEGYAELERRFPALKFVEYRPDYSWMEDTQADDMKNPMYKEGGFYVKPKFDKYKNKEFFDKYGISEEQYRELNTEDISLLTPTKNIEEFKFLVSTIEMNKKILDLYDETGNYSEYQRQQISQQRFEKYADLSNIGNIYNATKEGLQDLYKNRRDEMEYGALIDDADITSSAINAGVKILPKYFLNKIEDPTVITENTIASTMTAYKSALLYKERKAIESKVKALEMQIANQQFINTGVLTAKSRIDKKGEVSNYLKKAKEYTDYHLYGIKQSRRFQAEINGRTVDITRIVNTFSSFVRFKNLAFNPITDATSAATGILNNLVDKMVGDLYHRSSANLSRSSVTAMMSDYLGEGGKINKKSELNAWMQFMNVKDATSKFANSSMSRGMRLIAKSDYIGSELGNLPVAPHNLMTVIFDTRLYNGQFYTYPEYQVARRVQGVNSKQASVEWKALSDKTLKNYTKNVNGRIVYNEAFAAEFDKPSEVFQKLTERTSARVKQLIQSADGVLSQEDQVMAQRDFISNLEMTHRGWLLINLARRFKKSQLNFETGVIEEGHYRTLMTHLYPLLKAHGKSIFKGDKESLKELQEIMTLGQRKNIRRAGIELGVFALAQALGMMMLAADDDDDTIAEDFARLIYIRTVSEYNSSFAVGIPGSLYDAIKEPVIGLDVFDKLGYQKLKNSYEEESLMKRLRSVTPLKSIDKFSDLDGTLQDFRHFNGSTLFYLGDQKEGEDYAD